MRGFYPIPGQQLVEFRGGMIGDAAEHVGEPTCGSTPFNLAVSINVNIAAARSPPRSEPANNHARRPRAIPRNARSAALFDRQIRPSSRTRVKAIQRLSM